MCRNPLPAAVYFLVEKNQKKISNFHGYQTLLDVGFCCPTFYTPGLVPECGPGAVKSVASIFKCLKPGRGMCNGRSSQLMAVSCLPRLVVLIDKHDIGAPLKKVREEFGFPKLTCDHVQNFCCEERQWFNRAFGPKELREKQLKRDPTYKGNKYYAPGMDLVAYQTFMPNMHPLGKSVESEIPPVR